MTCGEELPGVNVLVCVREAPPFDELQPSAENLAKYVLERVASRVSDDRVQIYKVRCFETPTSVATYCLD